MFWLCAPVTPKPDTTAQLLIAPLASSFCHFLWPRQASLTVRYGSCQSTCTANSSTGAQDIGATVREKREAGRGSVQEAYVREPAIRCKGPSRCRQAPKTICVHKLVEVMAHYSRINPINMLNQSFFNPLYDIYVKEIVRSAQCIYQPWSAQKNSCDINAMSRTSECSFTKPGYIRYVHALAGYPTWLKAARRMQIVSRINSQRLKTWRWMRYMSLNLYLSGHSSLYYRACPRPAFLVDWCSCKHSCEFYIVFWILQILMYGAFVGELYAWFCLGEIVGR